MKKTVKDLEVKNKKVLLRTDFNVPLDQNGKITDNTRIKSALPTINYLLSQNAGIIIVSHLGRPEGFDKKYSLEPIVEELEKLLNKPIKFANDIVGPDAHEKVKSLQCGQILLLENIRFEDGEENNDIQLAQELSKYADVYVNDAFGTAHRKHASTYGVASLMPNALGFLMGNEVNTILGAMQNPQKPFVAVLGGAKVSDKIPLIKNLVEKVDTLLIGGAMSMAFLKAKGHSVGNYEVGVEDIKQVNDILEYAKKLNKLIILPKDLILSKTIDANAKAEYLDGVDVKAGYFALDIGKKTAKMFYIIIKKSKTAIWNGPVGVFEIKQFSKGTKTVAKGFANSKGITIVGGGDTASAVKKFRVAKKCTHISTGGGASLKLFEGSNLPCVSVIADKE